MGISLYKYPNIIKMKNTFFWHGYGPLLTYMVKFHKAHNLQSVLPCLVTLLQEFQELKMKE